jgi:hypothetical protein
VAPSALDRSAPRARAKRMADWSASASCGHWLNLRSACKQAIEIEPPNRIIANGCREAAKRTSNEGAFSTAEGTPQISPGPAPASEHRSAAASRWTSCPLLPGAAVNLSFREISAYRETKSTAKNPQMTNRTPGLNQTSRVSTSVVKAGWLSALPIRRRADYQPRIFRSFDPGQRRKRPSVPQ